MSSYQLKIGKRIEKEHLPFWRRIKAFKELTGKCPTDKQFVEGIAKDHLKEYPDYYSRLKKAKL
jgi:hypothetical protein